MKEKLKQLTKLPYKMGKVADVVNNIIDHIKNIIDNIKTSVKVVELTQEEYDNLIVKDKTTLYIISDAN